MVHVGEDALDALHLVVLGQVFKDVGQLIVLHHLHVALGLCGAFRHDRGDLLGRKAKILGNVSHSIFNQAQTGHLHW